MNTIRVDLSLDQIRKAVRQLPTQRDMRKVVLDSNVLISGVIASGIVHPF